MIYVWCYEINESMDFSQSIDHSNEQYSMDLLFKYFVKMCVPCNTILSFEILEHLIVPCTLVKVVESI